MAKKQQPTKRYWIASTTRPSGFVADFDEMDLIPRLVFENIVLEAMRDGGEQVVRMMDGKEEIAHVHTHLPPTPSG